MKRDSAQIGKHARARCVFLPPMRHLLTPRLLLLSAASVLAAGASAAEPQIEVNVNVAMTPAGRKLPPPSPAKPVYYYPFVGGWREAGARVAGEQKPPAKPIVHQLARALARQGYLVIDAEHREPALLLVIFWGYMNPEIVDFGTPDEPQKEFFNRKEMLALVGGQALGMLDLDFEREAVLQGAEDDRYFVVVSAYDFAAARQKKKVLLWSARMSTPSAGVRIAEVIPGLITSGGPHFGRETTRPLWTPAPLAREGTVEVGTPTVVPEQAPEKDAPKK